MISISSISDDTPFATPSPPEGILRAFGWTPARVRIETAPAGFSDARVWKVAHNEKTWALKRWPSEGFSPAMCYLVFKAHAAGLSWIPDTQGGQYIQHAGHHWTVSSWQPGEPDPSPGSDRLRNAIEALSALHAVWRRETTIPPSPCHAVQLQHQRLASWTAAELEAIRTKAPAHFLSAATLFNQHRTQAMAMLQPWLGRRVNQHWCVGDLWSDHVLFIGDMVTGMIDFGGIHIDHPAQDLARLLGSYYPGNAGKRLEGTTAYRPYSAELEELTIILDEAGTLVGIGNWLRWLILEGRYFANPARVYQRIQQLIDRLLLSPFSHL